MPTLQYLDFESSDDGTGVATLDALANVAAQHLDALCAEVAQLLDWLQRHHGAPGPLEDGAAWDHALSAQREQVQPLRADWDGAGLQLAAAGPAQPPRTTLSLTLTGSPALCAEVLAAFGGD